MLCCLDHGSASHRIGVPAAQAQRGALALRRVRGTQPICRKPKMDDVAVGDGVILALEPKLAGVARAGLALWIGCKQIIRRTEILLLSAKINPPCLVRLKGQDPVVSASLHFRPTVASEDLRRSCVLWAVPSTRQALSQKTASPGQTDRLVPC